MNKLPWRRGRKEAGSRNLGNAFMTVLVQLQSYLLFALYVVVVDLPDEGLVLVDAQLLEERLSHLQQHDESLEEIPHAQNLALGRL